MIRFLVPQYLFALSLLAIPVIVHLFNFRRYKKVLFTNVRFLQELKEETSRISRLRHLLILATRLLAVASIVLAFAQPVIPAATSAPAPRTTRAVGIYVDNSFSMDAVSTDGVQLEVARNKAREIALAFPPSAKLQLLTNDFSAVEQRLMSRDDFLDALTRVKFSPFSRTLKEVLLRQKEALAGTAPAATHSFIVSDFQTSTFQLAGIDQDSLRTVSFVALPLQETPNLILDSCWLSSPVVQLNQTVELSVKVINSGTNAVENVPVRLLVNGAQKAVSGIGIGGGESKTITFSFTVTSPGWQRVTVQLTDHPITFDDTYYTSFEVQDKLQVLAIGEGAGLPYSAAVFGKDPAFAYRRSNTLTLDYSSFASTGLILLEDLQEIPSGLTQELKRYVENGGTVAVFPDSAAALSSYNTFCAALGMEGFSGVNQYADKVTAPDLQHPLFAEVFETGKMRDGRIDYPAVKRHFEPAGANVSGQPIMKLQGGGSLLYHYTLARGNVYLFTVPITPGFSNLSQHAVFPALLYRMALLSVRPQALSTTLGQSRPYLLPLQAPAGDETFHLTDGKDVDVIPSVRVTGGGILVSVGDQIPVAGHYRLQRGNTEVAVFSYNYNRQESMMKFQDEANLRAAADAAGLRNWDYLKAAAPDLSGLIKANQLGRPLWKYAIVAALIFLLTEILLIRYWKTA